MHEIPLDILRNFGLVSIMMPRSKQSPMVRHGPTWVSSYFGHLNAVCNSVQFLSGAYFREITISDFSSNYCVEFVRQIAGAARSVQAGCAVMVTESTIMNHNIRTSLFEDSNVTSVGILLNGQGGPEVLLHCIESLRDKKIALMGPRVVDRFNDIADIDAVKRLNLTLYPSGGYSNSTEGLEKSPCSLRMKLHIDEKGFIYPCLGLYGIEEWSLGQVTESVTELWRRLTDGEGNILQWFEYGVSRHNAPALKKTPEGDDRLPLPGICARHRGHILQELKIGRSTSGRG